MQPAGLTRPEFWLGTHKPHWLWSGQCDVPLFVSYRRLCDKARWKPATTTWALDSGGFSELARHGRWMTSPRAYCEGVARAQREIGRLAWAAIQDWMCEPAMIYGGKAGKVTCAGTGASVAMHQMLTVTSYTTLTELWPQYSDGPCPFVPVLQGWTMGDFERCADFYALAGVDVRQLPLTGLGSVCRRQSTIRISLIASQLAAEGITLHGFGVKTDGLELYAGKLASCDSLAWSYDAYRLGRPDFPGHTHQTCSNCLAYALRWRSDLLAGLYDLAA